MSTPQNKTVRSNKNVMVLHQVKNWQNWKMQGCFMQFLRLIFVKKLQGAGGALPPEPPLGAFCGPQAPTFQLTFPFLIPMPARAHYCLLSSAALVFECQDMLNSKVMLEFTQDIWRRDHIDSIYKHTFKQWNNIKVMTPEC